MTTKAMSPERVCRDFNYDRRLVPNAFVAEMDTGHTTLEEARKKTGGSIGYPGWCLLYYALRCSLSREEFNTVVECGTDWGFSSIIMAQALVDSGLPGVVHTIEIDEGQRNIALKNIEKSGVGDRIISHLGDTLEVLPIISAPAGVGFAFIDSDHGNSHVFMEFKALHSLLRDDSIVFFDNTNPIVVDGMQTERIVNGALKRIITGFGGNLINLPNVSWGSPGQAIWQRWPFGRDWGAGA